MSSCYHTNFIDEICQKRIEEETLSLTNFFIQLNFFRKLKNCRNFHSVHFTTEMSYTHDFGIEAFNKGQRAMTLAINYDNQKKYTEARDAYRAALSHFSHAMMHGVPISYRNSGRTIMDRLNQRLSVLCQHVGYQ